MILGQIAYEDIVRTAYDDTRTNIHNTYALKRAYTSKNHTHTSERDIHTSKRD